MKFNVNVEVTDDEIKRYGQDLFLKGIGAVMQSIGSAFDDPNAMMMFQQALGTVLQQGVQFGMRQRQQQQRGPYAAPMPGGVGPYPPPYGAPVPHAYYPPGPYGSGPQPYPYGAPPGANGPPGPNNVRPIRSEGAQVEQCFRVEANKQQEEGIGCCHCAAVNATYRSTCRNCGHQLCYVGTIVTPAPQGPPPPQVQAPQSTGYGPPHPSPPQEPPTGYGPPHPPPPQGPPNAP